MTRQTDWGSYSQNPVESFRWTDCKCGLRGAAVQLRGVPLTAVVDKVECIVCCCRRKGGVRKMQMEVQMQGGRGTGRGGISCT